MERAVDGIDCVNKIQKNPAGTKVGMNGHIVKPIDAAVIKKTLATIWK